VTGAHPRLSDPARPPRVLRNPHHAPAAVPCPAAGTVDQVRRAPARSFHRRLPGYRATPLRQAPAIAAKLGLDRLWIKDETVRLGLPSYKILGASWAAYRLLAERLGHEPDWTGLAQLRAALQPLGRATLVAATDGNHGRAVARSARWFGLRARILVPAGTAPARIAAIGSEGAAVEVVTGDYDDAVTRAREDAGADDIVVSDTARPGDTAGPEWVAEGYATITTEIEEALGGESPDVVAVQMGVGTLAATVVRGMGHRARVIVVEPATAACGLESAAAGRSVPVRGPHPSIMAGLNCGTVSTTAWPVLRTGVHTFVAVDDTWAEDAVRELHAVGLAVGETGAAGLAGVRALARDAGGPDRSLLGRSALVICTESPTDPGSHSRIVNRPG
jgi:diaminopropionate ammonia-lyase